MAPTHAVFHTLRVSAVQPLTEDSVVVAFDVPPELRDEYAFTQGQHVTIRCDLGGTGVRRNYSICSPATSGQLRIAVKRLPDGAFSSYAARQLRPGDQLEVMTPTGRFFTELDPVHEKHYVAVAAGSGIAPILSILATTLEIEPKGRFTLLYGSRTARTVMFLEELHDLKDRYPDRFQLLHFLSREQRDAPLLSGRIDREKLTVVLTRLLPSDDVDEWFLCGPFDMVQEIRGTLLDRGVDSHRIHLELFHATAAPRRAAPHDLTPATGSEVSITLDGRQTVFRLAADAEPVLDAVLQHRSDAPYACRGGVCGTCRAKLIRGSVRMDQNFALDADEVERGYVLTCQAHPTTDCVILDYDA